MGVETVKEREAPLGLGRLGLKAAIDLAVWTTAALIAFQLRVPNRWIDLIPLIGWYALAGVLVKLPLTVGFGLYRQVWRSVTLEDLCRLALVVAIGSAAMFAAGLMWYKAGSPFPRTVALPRIGTKNAAQLDPPRVRMSPAPCRSRRGRHRHRLGDSAST